MRKSTEPGEVRLVALGKMKEEESKRFQCFYGIVVVPLNDIYHNQLKFPESASVYPAGSMTYTAYGKARLVAYGNVDSHKALWRIFQPASVFQPFYRVVLGDCSPKTTR